MTNSWSRGIMTNKELKDYDLTWKNDYDPTKNLITATTLLFVTRPTRFWQAPHSAQGTTKPGKTWSGELFILNQQEIWVANIFPLSGESWKFWHRSVGRCKVARWTSIGTTGKVSRMRSTCSFNSSRFSPNQAHWNMRCTKICDFSLSGNKDSSLHTSIHYRRSWTKQRGKRSKARVLRWTWTSPQILRYYNNTNTLYDVL